MPGDPEDDLGAVSCGDCFCKPSAPKPKPRKADRFRGLIASIIIKRRSSK